LKTDLVEIYSALVEQRLDQITMEWYSKKWTVGLCAVSGPCTGRKGYYPGYPDDKHYTNQPIYIKSKKSTESLKWHRSLNIKSYIKAAIYHNGTEFDQEGFLRTSGGRVLTVVGEGNTLQEAREITYREIEKIYFKGIRWRKDIGLL